MTQGCRKIGIMGGTFDPIHYGHLVTAEAAFHEFGLDRIFFIPSGDPPHKTNHHVTDAKTRLLMTHLATASNPHFFTLDMEVERPGYSYTVDTLTALHQRYPEIEWYFITGADAFSEILTWKEPEKILHLCQCVAATRPGYSRRKVLDQIRVLLDNDTSSIHFLEVPALTISSSDIRERVRAGKPITYLLPAEVEHYIRKHQLYQFT